MIEKLQDFRLPRWDELPSVDLYLDQVLSFIDNWIGDYLSDGEKKVMTRTMINNYVKQKFINPPVNKKYDKLAVARLFVIAVLKSVYTITEVSKLIELALGADDRVTSYNRFCDMTENAVMEAFAGDTMVKYDDPADPRHILWNVSSSFACQLYVKKTYLQSEEESDK